VIGGAQQRDKEGVALPAHPPEEPNSPYETGQEEDVVRSSWANAGACSVA
jgi:hypothetical protein